MLHESILFLRGTAVISCCSSLVCLLQAAAFLKQDEQITHIHDHERRLYCLIITGLGIDQGLLNKLRFYPVALAQRGEDWREAKLWLEKHTQPESLILLDSGLIEGQSWITPELFEKSNENRLEYLCFPFRGPYNLNRPLVPVATNYDR